MSAMASQISSLTIVYFIVYSSADLCWLWPLCRLSSAHTLVTRCQLCAVTGINNAHMAHRQALINRFIVKHHAIFIQRVCDYKCSFYKYLKYISIIAGYDHLLTERYHIIITDMHSFAISPTFVTCSTCGQHDGASRARHRITIFWHTIHWSLPT